MHASCIRNRRNFCTVGEMHFIPTPTPIYPYDLFSSSHLGHPLPLIPLHSLATLFCFFFFSVIQALFSFLIGFRYNRCVCILCTRTSHNKRSGIWPRKHFLKKQFRGDRMPYGNHLPFVFNFPSTFQFSSILRKHSASSIATGVQCH